MTNIVANSGEMAHSRHSLSPAMALRTAWIAWIAMLVTPFFLFLAMIWKLEGSSNEPTSSTLADTWFTIAMLYMLFVVPASFFWRGHVFKAYWTGNPVAPDKYLQGMLSIWIPLWIGGIFSLIGTFVSNSALPNLVPALVAFMFFVTFWPSGRAMITHRGDKEDPQSYEEPR
jgi:hypothetical protein